MLLSFLLSLFFLSQLIFSATFSEPLIDFFIFIIILLLQSVTFFKALSKTYVNIHDM